MTTETSTNEQSPQSQLLPMASAEENLEESISAAASTLGRRARGKPKAYSQEEIERRRERLKHARACKKQQ